MREEDSEVRSSFEKGDRVVSNGPHAEVVCVSKNLCAKIPDEVSDEDAAFTVLGAIGLQGVRQGDQMSEVRGCPDEIRCLC